jgi:hypothetical protein
MSDQLSEHADALLESAEHVLVTIEDLEPGDVADDLVAKVDGEVCDLARTPAQGSCFFCLRRVGTKVFKLAWPAKWPWPIPDGAGFRMCGRCAQTLGDDAIARRVHEYALMLRAILPERN